MPDDDGKKYPVPKATSTSVPQKSFLAYATSSRAGKKTKKRITSLSNFIENSKISMLRITATLTKQMDEEWEDAASKLRTALGWAEDAPLPRRSSASPVAESDDANGDVLMTTSDADANARTLAGYISFLTPEILMPPNLPRPPKRKPHCSSCRGRCCSGSISGMNECASDWDWV
ncbi:hypothetical protein MSAN_01210700 [Mycena sanguinolenta]|uniref:Uncharacterized protein n=1 Tax=Mycena sanguinolenta TaxID=230812 RepID=A0A8H6YHL6_9AGAR|nr:hypothetical protein MSAN_01210700 [Mycena sanguinolenta]